jgi:hypothetical protein
MALHAAVSLVIRTGAAWLIASDRLSTPTALLAQHWRTSTT